MDVDSLEDRVKLAPVTSGRHVPITARSLPRSYHHRCHYAFAPTMNVISSTSLSTRRSVKNSPTVSHRIVDLDTGRNRRQVGVHVLLAIYWTLTFSNRSSTLSIIGAWKEAI